MEEVVFSASFTELIDDGRADDLLDIGRRADDDPFAGDELPDPDLDFLKDILRIQAVLEKIVLLDLRIHELSTGIQQAPEFFFFDANWIHQDKRAFSHLD